MPLFRIFYYDGSQDEVQSKNVGAAKEAAQKLHDAGVQKVVLIPDDFDNEDEGDDLDDADE